MLGTCRLNNKSMRNIRRTPEYQCLVIDLAMLSVISREEAEMLLGSGIPNNLLLPNGTSGTIISEKDIADNGENDVDDNDIDDVGDDNSGDDSSGDVSNGDDNSGGDE